MSNQQKFSDEWETKQLGNIFSIRTGSSKSQYIAKGGRYIIVDMGSVATDGQLIVSKFTDYEGDFLKEGDLVMPKDDIGGGKIIGKVAYIDANNTYVLGDHVYVLRLLEGHPKFFSYLINGYQTNSSLRSKVGGSAQLGLSRKAVEDQEVPIPSLEEQRAIAKVLSDVDGLINAIDTLIDKKRAIKQATMQQLLTAKTRLPNFTGTWETKQLGEVGDISGAGVDKKVNPNDEPVRLVNYLDVYNKTFLYSKDLTHEVTARPDQVRRCAVEKGDIFFTPSSEVPDDIGCSAVAMENISDGVYSYHVVRLRLKMDWDLYFRAYIFNTKEFLDQASRQCEGSGTRYVISLPKFRAMTVRFPASLEEQRAIAQVLSDIDAEITALEQRKNKTIAIKQGIMQQLLTGKTRLLKTETPTP